MAFDRKAYMKAWNAKNKDRLKQYRKKNSAKHSIKIKLQVMTKYGGKCIGCQCNELAVLTIDHKNDDGAAERKAKPDPAHFYRELAKLNIRRDLQILCHSCQWRKRIYGPDIKTWKSKAIMISA